MSEHWRKRTRTAFRFWEQILKSWDEAPESAGHYAHLIRHLRRFEPQTADTFQFVLERGADPVYILHVLIKTCDETRVSKATGFPQVFSQERSGSPKTWVISTSFQTPTYEPLKPLLRPFSELEGRSIRWVWSG